MFYGPGAGNLPNGSSLVSDIISIVKNKNQVPTNKSVLKEPHPYEFQVDETGVSKYYLRISLLDEPTMLQQINKYFVYF